MTNSRFAGAADRLTGLIPPDILLVVARIFMASPFIIFGIMKYVNRGKMSAYVERAGIPGDVIWLIIPYQVLCGVALVLGWRSRLVSFLLGGFCVVATILYHHEWARSGELSNFTKDFAMAGGFLFLWVYGPGRYSLDARRHAAEARAPAVATTTQTV